MSKSRRLSAPPYLQNQNGVDTSIWSMVGVNKKTIGKWERGKLMPFRKSYQQLIQYLSSGRSISLYEADQIA